MEQREIDAELASAEELLASTSAAHLAYTAKDGTPRVVPVGCFWTGAEFVISTAETAPKVAALRADPDVAIAMESGGSPGDARALSVRGRVSIEILDGLVPEYVEAARRNMDPESAAEFERRCREMYDRMARIALVPTWARYWDFGSGRMPRFLQELADRADS